MRAFSTYTAWRWLAALLIIAFSLFSLTINVTEADAACSSSGTPSVVTNKEDYAPGDTVIITGGGMPCGATLTVKVTRPDGSVVKGDGSFAPGSDTVVADDAGKFTYNYKLNGITGTYLVEVIDPAGAVLATTTFIDSHFRFGHLSWKLIGTNPNQVEFESVQGWRRSAFSNPNVGDTRTLSSVSTGGGTPSSINPTYTVFFVDVANDWFLAKATFTVTYPGAGPFNVFSASCCRIGPSTGNPRHINNPDQSWRLEAIVNLNNGNTASPKSSLPVIVDCPKNAVCNFAVVAADPDVSPGGQNLTWRLATPTEMGGTALTQPGPPKATNAASINATTGVYTWNTTGATMSTGTGANAETLYSTQVVIEDRTAAGVLISKSPIDFFIRIALTTTNNAPQFVAPSPASGTVFSVPAGQNLSFTIKASDADPLDLVSLNVIGLPSGASFPLPAPGNPAQSTFSWTPTIGQIGSYAMTFTASDGKTSTTLSVGINVGALSLSKQAIHFSGPNPPEVGATSSYDILIGLSVPAVSPGPVTGINLTDPLPSWVTFQSIQSTTQGTASYDATNHRILWNVGNLNPGQAAQTIFRVSVTPTPADLGNVVELNNQAVATGTFGGLPLTVVSNTVHTAQVIQQSNQPPTANAGGPYTVGEGSSVPLSGSGTDPNGDPLTYSWDLDNNGSFETPGQNPVFSAAGRDGPSSQVVRLQVCDNKGLCATSQATVNITNVAPTATLNAPTPVIEGEMIALSLTGASDPSGIDASAGFQYAFDCGGGGGYGPFGPSSTANCPTTDAGTRVVKGKIRDKDNGVTEYTANVTVVVPNPPSFSIDGQFPPGACICTPLLMNTVVEGAEQWWAKAASSTMTLTLIAHSVNSNDPETVEARVYEPGGTQISFLSASYPAGTASGTEVSITKTFGTTTDTLYRIKITTPNTPAQQPHYKMKLNDAKILGTNSPSFASLETDVPVRWFFNVNAPEDLKLRIFSAGTPMGGGTFSNGTGVAVGAPMGLSGTQTITVTTAGTFNVSLTPVVSGTVTSGTATVAGSPVTLAAGVTTTITVTSTGTFTTAVSGTETAEVQVVDPNRNTVLSPTLSAPIPPGIDTVLTVPGAMTGQWRLRINTINAHYRLEKQSGSDKGIYVTPATSGFGSLSGTIVDSGGAPFLGSVTVNLQGLGNPPPPIMTTTASGGAFTFSHQFVGSYRVTVVPPLGTSIVGPLFFDVFIECDKTGQVQFKINRPPVANAGPDQTVTEGTTVTLTAAGSTDPDNNPLSYNWTVVSFTGPPVTLSSPTAVSPTFAATDDGVYTFKVTVSDGFGGVSSDQVVVTVKNVAPTATAAGATINENGTATVSGSITDPGTLDTFTVVINWGPGEGSTTLNLPAGSTSYSATHQYLDDNPTGTASDVYPVSVTVTDDDGGMGNAATTVTVNNVAPVITSLTATPLVALGNPTNLSGTFTDVGTKDTHTVFIDWGDSTTSTATVTETNGSGSFAASHTYATAQFYTITVTLKDDDTGSATQQIKVTVTATGKMTGGGRVDTGVTQAGNGKAPPQAVHTTHGFELFVNADLSKGGNLQYNDHRNGGIFHATSFTSIVFINDPALNPGNPAAKFDTAIVEGVGRLNSLDGVKFTAVITDNGEPGKTDTFKISFPGGQSPGIAGVLVVGNHQAHPLP